MVGTRQPARFLLLHDAPRGRMMIPGVARLLAARHAVGDEDMRLPLELTDDVPRLVVNGLQVALRGIGILHQRLIAGLPFGVSHEPYAGQA